MAARIFTPDEIAVIRERHFGWEKATPKLLATVFGVSVQRITAVLNKATPQDHGRGEVGDRGGVSHTRGVNP